VREVWYAMLQSIPGMSAARAANVVQRFPTFATLMTHLERGGTEDSLAMVIDPGTNRTALSRRIVRFMLSTDPSELLV
jgi:ERCC4-type nuclease